MEPKFKTFPFATFGRPESFDEFCKKWREQVDSVRFLKSPPLFSVVLLGGEKSEATLDSIRAQSYPKWEIVSGVDEAKSDWVVFVENGDRLNPSALFFFAMEISRDSSLDVIYANEIWLSKDGKRNERFLSKPKHSEFTLSHFNYVGPFFAVRRSLLPNDWVSEHELILTVARKTSHFKLVPAFLYYRRYEAAAIQIDEIGAMEFRETKFSAGATPVTVSTVICFKDRSEWTLRALRSLVERAGNVALQVVLVNNNSSEEELSKVRAGLSNVRAELSIDVKLVDYPHPFNFAGMHNWAVTTHCTGEILFLLNNDVFLQKGTVEQMAAWARRDWVGTVGMLLRYGHGGVQHGGIRAFYGGPARLVRVGHESSDNELTTLNREVFANTFAACVMKRKTYDEVGGLRPEDLPNGFGDVAFNFECLRRGLRNLYLGEVEGTHLESATRGAVYEYWEECRIEKEYGDLMASMLREDLGFDRVPGADLSLKDFARDWLVVKAREKTLWMKPVKQRVKKILRTVSDSRDNLKSAYERTRPKTNS